MTKNKNNQILSMDQNGNWRHESNLTLSNNEIALPKKSKELIDYAIAKAIAENYITEIDQSVSGGLKPFAKITGSSTEVSLEIGVDLQIKITKKYGTK